MDAIKTKIIRNLLDSEKPKSIRGLARDIDTNYSNTYTNIRSMREIDIEPIGHTRLVRLKRRLTEDIYIAESRRKESLIQSEIFRNIARKVDKTRDPFLIVLVFGSSISMDDPDDIDLCIITDNTDTAKGIEDNLSTLSYNIDMNTFDSEEFRGMITTKSHNVGNEIITKNIILKGIENYYRLLECLPSEDTSLKGSYTSLR